MHDCQKRPAAFLDRDGTVIKTVPYIKDPSSVKIPAPVLTGLAQLRDAGFLLILISNQSGVARGFFSETEMLAVHNRMCELLSAAEITLDGYYYCVHDEKPGSCNCRKPLTGMLQMACRDFAIDLQRSAMFGDSDCDLQLAKNFQIPGLLVEPGGTANPKLADLAAQNFQEAAEWLINYAAKKR